MLPNFFKLKKVCSTSLRCIALVYISFLLGYFYHVKCGKLYSLLEFIYCVLKKILFCSDCARPVLTIERLKSTYITQSVGNQCKPCTDVTTIGISENMSQILSMFC